MTIQAYEIQRERAHAGREEAAYLRALHRTATCGLPARFTGYHYGNAEVRLSVAMRMADMYLVWAAEYEETAERIEADIAQMIRSSAEMTEPTNHMNGLIERSSFGDVEATAARENVSDAKARALVERSKRMSQDHANRSNEGESR